MESRHALAVLRAVFIRIGIPPMLMTWCTGPSAGMASSACLFWSLGRSTGLHTSGGILVLAESLHRHYPGPTRCVLSGLRVTPQAASCMKKAPHQPGSGWVRGVISRSRRPLGGWAHRGPTNRRLRSRGSGDSWQSATPERKVHQGPSSIPVFLFESI